MAETSEQKSARLKAYWAAKKAEQATQNKNPKQTENEQTAVELPPISSEEQWDPPRGPQPGQVPDMQNVDVGELLQRIQELEAAQWRNQAHQTPQSGVYVGHGGNLVGTHEKYLVDPQGYPNPSERLSRELRLQRFAFKENYELEWQVGVSSYQTKDGVNTREPKFTIDLNRIMYDEDSGERTNRRYTVCRAIFHEDPQAALVVAQENGVDVKAYEEKVFLDEMRYLRVRDWLMEAFYPRPPQVSKRKKEMVIGNRVVEVFEINSESNEKVPFNELNAARKL